MEGRGALLFRTNMWGQTETVQHLLRPVPSSVPSKPVMMLPSLPATGLRASVCVCAREHPLWSDPHLLAGGSKV